MIYELIMFHDETQMLQLHLNVLKDVVDHFVICELDHTFSGKKKDQYNSQSIPLFPFQEKIAYVLAKLPNGFDTSNRWNIENYQRNMCKICLEKFEFDPDDVILISDTDEIADPDLLQRRAKWLDSPMSWDTWVYYYYLDYQLALPEPTTSKCMVMSRVKDWKGSVQDMRNMRLGTPSIRGGWHFSYMGGVNRIIQKLGEFSHAEYDSDYYKDPARLEKIISQRKDLFDRPMHFEKIQIRYPYHPQYLVDHIDEYSNFVSCRE